MGKYQKRLYIDPKFDINEKIKSLNTNKEHYLSLIFPILIQIRFTQNIFQPVNQFTIKNPGVIEAFIYDCRKAPDIK